MPTASAITPTYGSLNVIVGSWRDRPHFCGDDRLTRQRFFTAGGHRGERHGIECGPAGLSRPTLRAGELHRPIGLRHSNERCQERLGSRNRPPDGLVDGHEWGRAGVGLRRRAADKSRILARALGDCVRRAACRVRWAARYSYERSPPWDRFFRSHSATARVGWKDAYHHRS